VKRHRAVLVLLVVVACHGYNLRADDTTIAAIRDTNKNSLDSMQTLYAKYKVVAESKTGKGTRSVTECEWWQDGPKARWVVIRELVADAPPGAKTDKPKINTVTREEGVLIGDEVKIQTRQRVGKQDWTEAGVIKAFKRDDYLGQDVWVQSLMILLVKPRASLSDLLSKGAKVEWLGAEQFEGRPCPRLRITPTANNPNGMRYDIMVDPRYNHLVRACRQSSDSPNVLGRGERFVVKVQECAPGLYFPAVIEYRKVRVWPGVKEELTNVTTTFFDKVVVNQPIPAETFKFDFKPGTSIWNQRDQTQYKVGKDQKPDGPVEAVPVGQQIQAEPSYSEQPSFWGRYYLAILFSALGVVVVAAAWWFVGRKRSAL
jgi:hypothetical protein